MAGQSNHKEKEGAEAKAEPHPYRRETYIYITKNSEQVAFMDAERRERHNDLVRRLEERLTKKDTSQKLIREYVLMETSEFQTS